MINLVHRLLRRVGINPHRLLLEWVSAAEGPRFAQVITSFTDRIKELGPLGSDCAQGTEFLQRKLEAAFNAASGEKLRWVAAKQTEFRRDGNRYGEVFTDQEIGRMLDGVVLEEVTLQEILLLLQKQPLSVKELAQTMQVPTPDIMAHVQALRKREKVKVAEVRDRSPLYTIV